MPKYSASPSTSLSYSLCRRSVLLLPIIHEPNRFANPLFPPHNVFHGLPSSSSVPRARSGASCSKSQLQGTGKGRWISRVGDARNIMHNVLAVMPWHNPFRAGRHCTVQGGAITTTVNKGLMEECSRSCLTTAAAATQQEVWQMSLTTQGSLEPICE
jgi:hypothetical protein